MEEPGEIDQPLSLHRVLAQFLAPRWCLTLFVMPVPRDLMPSCGPSMITRHIQLTGKNTDKWVLKRNPGRSSEEKQQKGLFDVAAVCLLDSFTEQSNTPEDPKAK